MFDKETIEAARLLPVQPPEALAEQVLRHQRAHSAANRVVHDEFSAVPWEARRTMPAYWRARACARHERDQQRIASYRLALDFVEPAAGRSPRGGLVFGASLAAASTMASI